MKLQIIRTILSSSILLLFIYLLGVWEFKYGDDIGAALWFHFVPYVVPLVIVVCLLTDVYIFKYIPILKRKYLRLLACVFLVLIIYIPMLFIIALIYKIV